MKKLLVIFNFIALVSVAYAQKGSVGGTLLDSANKKSTINYATVSLYKGSDTTLTDYKLSNDKGVFKLTGLSVGVPYRLVINAWLFSPIKLDVKLSADKPDIDLGNIYLSEKTNMLNEVVINDVPPPVLVRKDTIEFNAASFKTLPSAVVEDLLKKLPGVFMAEDGSIQVNGKTVSKILVDGKEFFGGDQQIATKNLPANIIDKVQVTEDKEAKRRDPDILEANVPQVINLKLKRSIKKGAFGKLYGGAGLDERFEAGGIMNFFRDTSQVSLIAYGNNVNKPGFNISDISRIGGFQRMGINMIMINSEGGFELNGIGFGGSANGITQSSGGGANFNTLLKKGHKINARYFFGQSNKSLLTLMDRSQNLETGNLFTSSNTNQRDKNYSHILGGKAEFKLDSLTKLTLEPMVSITSGNNNFVLGTQGTNGSGSLLHKGTNNGKTKSTNTEYQLNTNLWRDFKKNGRSFNSSLNFSKKNNLNDNFTNAITYFYSPNSTQLLDQLRDNDIINNGGYLSLNYTEPLSKKLSLTVANNTNYIDNENALVTFIKDPNNQAYDIVVPNLSQSVFQDGFKSNTRLNANWKVTKDFNIRPGIVFNTISLNNTFTSYPAFEQDFSFLAPSLNLKYKNVNLSYLPSFIEPNVNYIQPVANNTNPLFVQNGNPDLLPTKSHQFSLNVYKYDSKRTLNYNVYGNATLEDNGITMSRTIASNGAQTSTPINVDGVLRLNGGLTFNKDFKKPKRNITIGAGFWANYTRNIVQINNIRSYSRILGFTPRTNLKLNLNDKIEVSSSYNLGINSSDYDDPYYKDINYLTHTTDNELVIRWPKKLVWETSYKLMYNTQTVAGFNNNIQIWNAALTYLFMKNDRAQLKFSVNDMLNTNTRRNVYIVENSTTDVRYNNLGRYGLLTFTYNIQNFGGKVGGKDTMFRF